MPDLEGEGPPAGGGSSDQRTRPRGRSTQLGSEPGSPSAEFAGAEPCHDGEAGDRVFRCRGVPEGVVGVLRGAALRAGDRIADDDPGLREGASTVHRLTDFQLVLPGETSGLPIARRRCGAVRRADPDTSSSGARRDHHQLCHSTYPKIYSRCSNRRHRRTRRPPRPRPRTKRERSRSSPGRRTALARTETRRRSRRSGAGGRALASKDQVSDGLSKEVRRRVPSDGPGGSGSPTGRARIHTAWTVDVTLEGRTQPSRARCPDIGGRTVRTMRCARRHGPRSPG